MVTPGNAINEATTGICGFTGTAFTGTAATQYNVLVGGSTSSTLSNVAPSATSGVPVISQGAAANPVFGTAVVAGGGTSSVSFNINGPVIAGTTTTSALTSVTLGLQQFLVGNTSAAPTAKSLSVVRQVFTSTGTYTPTAGMVYCDIEVVGGGGGSGGIATTNASQTSVSGGGGAGGYARKVVSAATIGASQTATVGAAGLAGTIGATTGGTGGTSSLGAIVTATGGVGSTGTAPGIEVFSNGGAGGAGASGDFNTNGQPGGYANGLFITGVFTQSFNGYGGSSFFGGGAPSTMIAVGQQAGTAGVSFGGGASGAINQVNQTQIVGAAGAKGIVVVTEYVLS